MLQGNLQRILESLNTAVLTLDEDLRLTYINPAGEMLIKLSAGHVLGQELSQVLPGNDPLTENLRKSLSTGRLYTNRGIQLRLPADKSVTVDYTVTPFSDGDCCAELLLELSPVDRLLRLAREETMLDQHATSRAVLKRLAHEIKNPLGGLRGAAQLLQRELPERSLREFTHIIIHEADRLSTLVDRMMGSTQPLKREPVNIHRVLEHVRSLIAVEFPAGVTIERDYDPSAPEFIGDPDQITQAALNIVRNSAQAAGENGNIVLRTRVERQVTISQVCHRLVLRTDVEDDGPGIPEHLVKRIFYPMVSDKAEGTGLGLSIAQDIISRHGGVIACHSQPRKTVFSILLPVEDTNAR